MNTISLELLAKTALDLAKLPENTGQSPENLVQPARRFLEACQAALDQSTSIHSPGVQALLASVKADDALAQYLGVTPTDLADGRLEFKAAVEAITGLPRPKTAWKRFRNFVDSCSDVERAIGISLATRVSGWRQTGVPAPFVDPLRLRFAQWWRHHKDEQARSGAGKRKKAARRGGDSTSRTRRA